MKLLSIGEVRSNYGSLVYRIYGTGKHGTRGSLTKKIDYRSDGRFYVIFEDNQLAISGHARTHNVLNIWVSSTTLFGTNQEWHIIQCCKSEMIDDMPAKEPRLYKEKFVKLRKITGVKMMTAYVVDYK